MEGAVALQEREKQLTFTQFIHQTKKQKKEKETHGNKTYA